MSVDKDNVIKIANLSKISFKDHEIEKILEDLNQIIDWVDQLTEVNTDKVSPTFSSFDNDKTVLKDSGVSEEPSLTFMFITPLSSLPVPLWATSISANVVWFIL